MRTRVNAILCLCLTLTFVGPVAAQQKRELTESQKVLRLDIVPAPTPSRHPKAYVGTSFRSLRVPGLTYGYLSANGRNFFYERIGYGAENIVVVHGGPGLPHNYLLPALHNLAPYATIWFFDARGHGLSEQNYPNEAYTMQQLVDDVGAFVVAAGVDSNYTVLGHSFGGMVALQHAIRRPAGLRRLILSDTAPSLAYAADLQENLRRVMGPQGYEQYEQIQRNETITPDERLRRALRMIYPFYWYSAPADYYLDQDILAMNLNATAADQVWSNTDPEYFDVRDELDNINVPTLVMVGRHDIITGVGQAQLLADGIPNAKLVVFEHSGHYPFFEENHLFTQWVKSFLHYFAV